MGLNAILEFLIISCLNSCFVSKVQWDNGPCAGSLSFSDRFSATCFPQALAPRPLQFASTLLPLGGVWKQIQQRLAACTPCGGGVWLCHLSQVSRVTGDLTGMSLHPGTKHIPAQRFKSFRSHLSLWVGSVGPWEGDIDLFAPGQGTVWHFMSTRQLLGGESWQVHNQ